MIFLPRIFQENGVTEYYTTWRGRWQQRIRQNPPDRTRKPAIFSFVSRRRFDRVRVNDQSSLYPRSRSVIRTLSRSALPIARASMSVLAMAWAERGKLSISDISPK